MNEEEEPEVNMEVYTQYRGWEKVVPLLKQLKRELKKEHHHTVGEILEQLEDIKTKSKNLYGDKSEEYIVARKVLSDAKQLVNKGK